MRLWIQPLVSLEYHNAADTQANNTQPRALPLIFMSGLGMVCIAAGHVFQAFAAA
jgi:hypothetical protein